MFSEINIERKQHLQEASDKIRKYINNKSIRDFTKSEIVKEAKYLYRKIYNDELSVDETNYFSMLVIIPDDSMFKKICNNRIIDTSSKPYTTKHDFDKIGEAYGVKSNIARLRYMILLDNFKNNLIHNTEKKKVKG